MRKRKKLTNLKKSKISVAILLLAITLMMVAPLPSEAQTMYNTGQYLTLPIDIPTFLFVSAAPDPVGVSQTVYLSAIFSKPVPTSTALNGDMYLGITIKVTDPEGQVTTLGPHDDGQLLTCQLKSVNIKCKLSTRDKCLHLLTPTTVYQPVSIKS